jgi:DNA-binding PadR family transcriptional regulator
MILGSLMAGPAHGYEIMKRIAESFGTQYPNLSHSAVYPRLAQFEKAKLIWGKVEPQRDAPSRKVYQLTKAGFERIKELVATPIEMKGSMRNTYVDELAVHIVYFSLVTKAERRRVIEPYYNFTVARYDDAVRKLKVYSSGGLDKFVLAFLEHGVLLLRETVRLYEKLMELD